MNSDPHFQQIFQAHPEWIFDILGKAAPIHCCFTSPVAKAVQRQLDGYLTGDGEPPRVVELQMWKDALIYLRAGMELAQVSMQVFPLVPEALIIFGSADFDTKTQPWCQFIRAYYLDEEIERIARENPQHLLPSVLFPLLEKDDTKLVSEGQLHYRRILASPAPQKDREVLLRVLTDFLFQRLPQYSHSQIAMMMNFPPLEETEGYKSMIREATEKGLSQGLSQGLSRGIIRLAHRRFPASGPELDEAISELDYLQLERLADTILDLPDLASLRAWLLAESKA